MLRKIRETQVDAFLVSCVWYQKSEEAEEGPFLCGAPTSCQAQCWAVSQNAVTPSGRQHPAFISTHWRARTYRETLKCSQGIPCNALVSLSTLGRNQACASPPLPSLERWPRGAPSLPCSGASGTRISLGLLSLEGTRHRVQRKL